MKKLYFLSCLLIVGFTSNAQYFTKVWAKYCNGTDYTWFNTATNNNNVVGMAYNPATNKLLVSSRNANVYIINAATGAEEGTLSLTGLGSEAFKFNKIRVTSDGVIYGISLATGAGQCKIYRWENQTATPTLCADFAVTERTGDSFGLSGTGMNTVLYASGAALAGVAGPNTKIYVLTTNNGTNFLNTSTISVPSGTGAAGQWTNRSVDPIGATPADGIWVDMSGGPARRLSISGSAPSLNATSAFTTTTGYNNGQVADAYCGLRYLQTPSATKFLAFAGANNAGDGITMRLMNVTDEGSVSTVGTDTLYAPGGGGGYWTYQTNGNGTGEVAFKANGNGSYDIFYLATNNGIACVRTPSSLPVTLSSFNATIRNKAVVINWSTATEINNEGFVIEKSVNGRDFSKIGFVASKAIDGNSTAAINYQFEDGKLLDGKSYYRLRQVDKDGKAALSETKTVQNAISGFTVKVLSNPVSENIVLSMKTNTIKQVQLTLTNASGAVLMSRNQQIAVGDNNVNIPVQQYATGLLFLSVKDGDNNQVIKIVKQ